MAQVWNHKAELQMSYSPLDDMLGFFWFLWIVLAAMQVPQHTLQASNRSAPTLHRVNG